MRLISRLASRTTTPRRRPTAQLRLQALEDRSLPSFGFGSAFSFGARVPTTAMPSCGTPRAVSTCPGSTTAPLISTLTTPTRPATTS